MDDWADWCLADGFTLLIVILVSLALTLKTRTNPEKDVQNMWNDDKSLTEVNTWKLQFVYKALVTV